MVKKECIALERIERIECKCDISKPKQQTISFSISHATTTKFIEVDASANKNMFVASQEFEWYAYCVIARETEVET